MDSAFATANFPSMTTKALLAYLAANDYSEKTKLMLAEVERRQAVAKGDKSVMTPGERLRFFKTGKAR